MSWEDVVKQELFDVEKSIQLRRNIASQLQKENENLERLVRQGGTIPSAQPLKSTMDANRKMMNLLKISMDSLKKFKNLNEQRQQQMDRTNTI